MVPIAFILEFFIVGKIAKILAFQVMTPKDKPQFITYAISICICCIMCPVMSLIATFLFKEPSFGIWIKTWTLNFPMAIFWQLFYCGPLVRFIFRLIFKNKQCLSPLKKSLEAFYILCSPLFSIDDWIYSYFKGGTQNEALKSIKDYEGSVTWGGLKAYREAINVVKQINIKVGKI